MLIISKIYNFNLSQADSPINLIYSILIRRPPISSGVAKKPSLCNGYLQ